MNYLLFPNDTCSPQRLGGKAASLAALSSVRLPIPEWFVVSPDAFRSSLNDQMLAKLNSGDQQQIQTVLSQLSPTGAVMEQVTQALARICPHGETVAVRSSAIDEDGSEHSFAGQMDSFLFVSPGQMAAMIAAVWRSGFSQRILTYRREKGLTPLPEPPAVLIQRMVDPEIAGVAFSADPVTGQRGIALVSAVYGLGTALVSGESDADTWRLRRDSSIVERTISRKVMAHRPAPGAGEGVRTEAVAAELADVPCLNDDQIRAVAGLARQAASHFGRPQDIEWAISHGKLYLLQSRPITSLALLPDPDGQLNIWDNSNIAESYGGITTPLTFSFARHIYEEVYRQFCRIMAVPPAAIEANQQVFPRMLGLVRGRVYYNLLSWYRLLALLPGFTLNRRFMEQMMGVKEGIPAEVLAESLQSYKVSPMRDRFNLFRSICGLISNQIRLKSNIASFYNRINTALAPPALPLQEQRPDELAAHYRMLEGQLLKRWDAPLVNDFFAMIFYGLLRKLTASWCHDSGETLQNDLLSGEGGIVSAEPAKLVRRMAEVAAEDNELTELLAAADAGTILNALEGHPKLKELCDSYLAKFADRCLDELKLESSTLQDDPTLLYRSIGEFARRIRSNGISRAVDESAIRTAAEARVNQALSGSPVKQLLFKWVLNQARQRVRDRENLRFERTRLFGRVRRIFVELGKRLHSDGLLTEPRDIFWLEKDEIFGFIEGTASTTDLAGLSKLRKNEFQRWSEEAPPADRFETRGMVSHAQACRSTLTKTATPEGDTLRGIGCCPGIVRGQVRVITDPRGAVIRQGEILVAERTDPGWIMLFPACSALLVERGSLLSHSAIVAREMGIPAIVSISGVTSWLKDGDLVEMDGASGLVRRINPQKASHAQ